MTFVLMGFLRFCVFSLVLVVKMSPFCLLWFVLLCLLMTVQTKLVEIEKLNTVGAVFDSYIADLSYL